MINKKLPKTEYERWLIVGAILFFSFLNIHISGRIGGLLMILPLLVYVWLYEIKPILKDK